MGVYIALLRGINIAGHKTVGMADLRDLLAKLGFDNPRSLLQSGNVVFGSARRNRAALEELLEAQTAKRFGLDITFVVRASDEWRGILSRNPFKQEALRDPAHVAVMFLKTPPDPADVRALAAAIRGPEVISVSGTELYAVYPDGFGRSRLTNAVIEKKLKTRATGRNWNTVVKLASAVGV